MNIFNGIPTSFMVVHNMQNDFIDGVLGSDDAKNIVDNVVKNIKNYMKLPDNRKCLLFTLETHYDYEDNPPDIEHCMINTRGAWLHDSILDIIRNTDTFDGRVSYIHKSTLSSFDIIKNMKYHLYDVYGENKHKDDNNNQNSLNFDCYMVGLYTNADITANAILIKTFFPLANIKLIEKSCVGTTQQYHKDAINVIKSLKIKVI